MAKPYSNDLRQRAVCAMAGGDPASVVAKRFGIAKSSVIKWHQRYRETGSVAPGKMGGHRKRVLDEHRDFILDAINHTSHLTLHGLKDMLGKQGIFVSHNAVWLFLKREGLSFKKNPHPWLGEKRQTTEGFCASWPLEHHDVYRSVTL